MKSVEFTNWLNVFLMAVSLYLAMVMPFELFLLAYAVLGPLHYLTEISWLHDRKYFLREKREAWFFVLMAVIVLISGVSAFFGLFREVGVVLASIIPGLLFAGVIFAVGALVLEKFWQKAAIFLGAFWVVVLTGWQTDPGFKALFATLLPTMIHVFVFTGAFILLGSFKSRSLSGIISLITFVVCALLAIVLPVGILSVPSQFVAQNYNMYFGINQILGELLGFGKITSLNEVFNSPTAWAVMRLIAFSYTYHYLNWFSKTTVIKWQKISSARWIGIFCAWVISVALYLADYRLGFISLYLLSMLHVFLEFPLNALTFAEIGKFIFSRNSTNRS